jgi:hypothetical protein
MGNVNKKVREIQISVLYTLKIGEEKEEEKKRKKKRKEKKKEKKKKGGKRKKNKLLNGQCKQKKCGKFKFQPS